MALNALFAQYDRLFLFDTETTGLDFMRDEIIEFAAIVVELRDGVPTVTEEYDELITLTPGNTIPLKIPAAYRPRQRGCARAGHSQSPALRRHCPYGIGKHLTSCL